jgi:hypothetical protein
MNSRESALLGIVTSTMIMRYFLATFYPLLAPLMFIIIEFFMATILYIAGWGFYLKVVAIDCTIVAVSTINNIGSVISLIQSVDPTIIISPALLTITYFTLTMLFNVIFDFIYIPLIAMWIKHQPWSRVIPRL